MSKGIAVPVRLDLSGKIAMNSDDDDAIQTISLMLADNDSDNAFQQEIGLMQTSSYALEVAHRAETIARVLLLFEDFEKKKKFRLLKETVRWITVPGAEEELAFSFINMESDTQLKYQKSLSPIVR